MNLTVTVNGITRHALAESLQQVLDQLRDGADAGRMTAAATESVAGSEYAFRVERR